MNTLCAFQLAGGPQIGLAPARSIAGRKLVSMKCLAAAALSHTLMSRHVEPSVVEKEFFETVRPSSLLKRFATTDEVAALAAFVASPLSSATNGAALRVDGGVVRSII